MQQIVIIGNGIAGITCARHIRKKSDDAITVVSAETDHFFSRTALMYIYMGHMKYEHTKPYEDWFWKKNRIGLIKGYVQRLDIDNKTLIFAGGKTLQYDLLIIASGSKSKMIDCPGSDLQGVQGLYSYPDLQKMEKSTGNIRGAVVVGGGLIGIEMAEMLRSRQIKVTFLIREKQFWGNVLPAEEGQLINDHLLEHNIDLRLETELKKIKGENGRVKSIMTSSGEEIACEFVGMAVGVYPNIDFLKSSIIETDKGILVNEYFETNVPGIYAIGDCVQFRQPPAARKALEQIWYTGRAHGEILARTICGNDTAYLPKPWFNSAKFFDIEFQTYGNVPPTLSKDQEDFFWKAATGHSALHFVYESTSHRLIGVNALGLRLRHELFQDWLEKEKTIEFVLKHLRAANFDTEFYRKYEREVIKAFNRQTGSDIGFSRKNFFRFSKQIQL